jgi:hypothetical protein
VSERRSVRAPADVNQKAEGYLWPSSISSEELETMVRQMKIEGGTLEDCIAELRLLADFVHSQADGLRDAWPTSLRGTYYEEWERSQNAPARSLHQIRLTASRAAIDEGDACDPATDIDGETSKALTEPLRDELVAKSNAEMTAVNEQTKKRPMDLFKGTLRSDFFEPLPEDELRLWNGEESEAIEESGVFEDDSYADPE